MRWLALLALVGLVLSGCSSPSEEGSTSTTDGTGTGTGTGTRSVPGTGSGTGTSTGTSTGTAAPGPNQAPTASLKADKTSGTAPLNVTFTLGGSDPDGDDLTATLDLGAGPKAVAQFPGTAGHSFTTAGNFTVRLVVSDGTASANATVTVTVTAPVEAPSGPAYCHRDPVQSVGDLMYLSDDGGGTWVFMESNDVPGLQVGNSHPGDATIPGAHNAEWEMCEDPDQMVF